MLKFEIKSQNLKLIEKPGRDIVEDQLKYMKINFVFDESWVGLDKLLQMSQRLVVCENGRKEEKIINIDLGDENDVTIDFPPGIEAGELAFTILGRVTHNEKDKIIYDRKVITTTYSIRITKSYLNQENLDIGQYDSDMFMQTGDKFFVYTQLEASKLWHIEHRLEKYPSVTIIDSAGTNVVGDVIYIDNKNLKIIFSNIMSGKAYLN